LEGEGVEYESTIGDNISDLCRAKRNAFEDAMRE